MHRYQQANQPGANIGTDIIDKLCRYFGCQPADLLMFVDDEPECGEPHRTLGTLSAKASESRSGAAGRIKTNERRAA